MSPLPLQVAEMPMGIPTDFQITHAMAHVYSGFLPCHIIYTPLDLAAVGQMVIIKIDRHGKESLAGLLPPLIPRD